MANPKDVYQWLGMTDTDDYGPAVSIDPTQPFEIGPNIWKYKRMKHPFLSWMMKKAKHDPTKSIVFGHLEKPDLPSWIQFTGTTETVQGTTGLVFEDGETRLSKYSRIRTESDEVIHFTADFVATDTSAGCTRNVGTSGTPFLVKGEWCKIIPPGIPEGSDMGKGPQGGKVYKKFYTGIVEWPVEMTGSKAAERANGADTNDPFKEALGDALGQAQDQEESDLIWGAGHIDNSNHTYSLHTSTGLKTWIETNVWDVDGTITRLDFWDIIAEWYDKNPEGGAIVASGQLLRLLNNIAFQKVQYNQDLKSDGLNINSFTVPGVGTVDILKCDLLGQSIATMGTVLLIPATGHSYRPLIGREVGYKPVVRDEKDVKAGHIHGERGWEFFGEERFGIVNGLEF